MVTLQMWIHNLPSMWKARSFSENLRERVEFGRLSGLIFWHGTFSLLFSSSSINGEEVFDQEVFLNAGNLGIIV